MLLMLSEKGKYASATENRRFVWANIVWPLILDVNDVAFSLQQFQNKRDIVCKEKNISINIPSRGLVSLMQKGIIRKEDKIYSIHFRLINFFK
jgi:flavin reductase (DIM6/NTAB) family NADH-FMN oxidoreductase RutF